MHIKKSTTTRSILCCFVRHSVPEDQAMKISSDLKATDGHSRTTSPPDAKRSKAYRFILLASLPRPFRPTLTLKEPQGHEDEEESYKVHLESCRSTECMQFAGNRNHLSFWRTRKERATARICQSPEGSPNDPCLSP